MPVFYSILEYPAAYGKSRHRACEQERVGPWKLFSKIRAGDYAEPSQGQVEAILDHSGPYWSNLGPSWGHCRQSGPHFGPSWANLGHLGRSLALLGAFLGPSWGHLEAKLEPS